MTDLGIELEEKDAQAVKDRLNRDATNGDKAHNALADAACWNIDHSVANLKELRELPTRLITLMKEEKMCGNGIIVPLPGGRSIKATGSMAVMGVILLGVIYLLGKVHGVI